MFPIERSLSIKEFADFIGYSYHVARRLVENEPGVLAIGRIHKTRRIPLSLAEQIRERLKQRRVA